MATIYDLNGPIDLGGNSGSGDGTPGAQGPVGPPGSDAECKEYKLKVISETDPHGMDVAGSGSPVVDPKFICGPAKNDLIVDDDGSITGPSMASVYTILNERGGAQSQKVSETSEPKWSTELSIAYMNIYISSAEENTTINIDSEATGGAYNVGSNGADGKYDSWAELQASKFGDYSIRTNYTEVNKDGITKIIPPGGNFILRLGRKTHGGPRWTLKAYSIDLNLQGGSPAIQLIDEEGYWSSVNMIEGDGITINSTAEGMTFSIEGENNLKTGGAIKGDLGVTSTHQSGNQPVLWTIHEESTGFTASGNGTVNAKTYYGDGHTPTHNYEMTSKAYVDAQVTAMRAELEALRKYVGMPAAAAAAAAEHCEE